MLKLFLKISALVGLGGAAYTGYEPEAPPRVPSWYVMPTEVTSGGCVLLVVNAPSREVSDWALRINEREPRKLVDGLGPTFRHRGKTVVILAFDLTNPEGFRIHPGTPDEIQVVPIFEREGEVRITVESQKWSLGTETVTVSPASPDAVEAIELLYPVLVRGKGVSDPADATWMQLLTDHMFGVTPRTAPEQLQQLRDELPIIMRHPDWAEIAEMLVARLEARLHSRELTASEEGQPAKIKPSIGDLPPWPDIVTRCLKRKPQSPFAEAIQRDIRGTVRGIRILDAQRRGEDIWPILREAARVPENRP